MAEKYLLQVKNLKIALKVDKNFIPVVDDVDLSLEPGKVLGLVGESGCGKSVTALSLLRLLSKELKIVDGKILFYGQNGDGEVDIAKLEPKGKDIQRIRGGTVSMIFQEPMSSFSPLHTIGYQIMEVIQLHLNASREKHAQSRSSFWKELESVTPSEPSTVIRQNFPAACASVP